MFSLSLEGKWQFFIWRSCMPVYLLVCLSVCLWPSISTKTDRFCQLHCGRLSLKIVSSFSCGYNVAKVTGFAWTLNVYFGTCLKCNFLNMWLGKRSRKQKLWGKTNYVFYVQYTSSIIFTDCGISRSNVFVVMLPHNLRTIEELLVNFFYF
jgi:hypothetical protein